jgi:hypothetical protein
MAEGLKQLSHLQAMCFEGKGRTKELNSTNLMTSETIINRKEPKKKPVL